MAPGYFVNIFPSVEYLANIVHFFWNQGTGVVDKMRGEFVDKFLTLNPPRDHLSIPGNQLHF